MIGLKNLARCVSPVKNKARPCSSGRKLIDLKTDKKTGIATVTMQRFPVNSMNYGLLSEFVNVLDDLENSNIRGMILTSASDRVFTAGLDLVDIYKPQKKKYKQIWTTLQDIWLKLYGSSFPTVAAINGNSPAGGCLLSMSCEYRVMVNNFFIGLNESQLGIVAPKWCVDSMQNIISKRDAELALTQGRLFTTEEAYKVGLIDEIASDKADALARAEKFFKRFANVHPMARQKTKISLRGKHIQDLLDNKEADFNNFWDMISQPMVQKAIGAYIESLKKKGK